jgi:hypothetical protein
LYVAFGYLGWAQQHHKIVSDLFSQSEMSCITPTSSADLNNPKIFMFLHYNDELILNWVSPAVRKIVNLEICNLGTL